MKALFQCIDDFCPELLHVRSSALASGFGTWSPNKGEVGSSRYDGMNFQGDHAFMLRSLSMAMGGVQVFPNSMFFRVTTPETERAYVHSDRSSGDLTCVVYMSEHKEEYGTAFFRHIPTGLEEMPTLEEMHDDPRFDELKRDMVSGEGPNWQRTGFISGKLNRAVIFHAPLFHARHPERGIGGAPEESRMVWVCHFRI